MQRPLATLILLTATTPAGAQWLTLTTPGVPRTADGEPDLSAPAPRTADGRPDLTGLWVPVEVSGDLLDPDKIQPWARAQIAANESNFFGDDPRFHCLPSGPGAYPAGRSEAGLRRIVQNPSVIAILNADLTYRQIFLDGRELETDPFPTWTGYSVGRWDDDTLVVESNGFNDRTWLHREGLPHTESLRITERYRRPDFGHIRLDVTYEDPGTFHGPVHASIDMEFVADSELLETVCNEASKGRTHWGGEISEAEDNVVEVDEAMLAKYVGTYQGVWLGNLITAEFTLEDGALFLKRTPPYSETGYTEAGKSRLIAQSDNAFECSCGLGFVFETEGEEMASEVAEVHVSGAWTFERVR
jgi:hypothetical protein